MCAHKKEAQLSVQMAEHNMSSEKHMLKHAHEVARPKEHRQLNRALLVSLQSTLIQPRDRR